MVPQYWHVVSISVSETGPSYHRLLPHYRIFQEKNDFATLQVLSVFTKSDPLTFLEISLLEI